MLLLLLSLQQVSAPVMLAVIHDAAMKLSVRRQLGTVRRGGALVNRRCY